jgi:hypothetical protein
MRSILRISFLGIAIIHIAVITRRLKAADPTIVPGPNLPGTNVLPVISITFRRISGGFNGDHPGCGNVMGSNNNVYVFSRLNFSFICC